MTRGRDIPENWKLYRLFVYCLRETSSALATGKEIKSASTTWEFGKVPAASAMHAKLVFWNTCPHEKPVLLGVGGNPVRKNRLKRSEIQVEEIAFDEEIPALETHHPVVE